MKLVKLAISAAIASIAAMAFFGAAPASAVTTHPWIALCDTNTLLLCPTEHLMAHPLLGRFLLLVGQGAFKAGPSIECESGMGDTNEVLSQQEKVLKAKLESFTFKGCKGCEKIEVAPVEMELTMGTELSEGDWSLIANKFIFTFVGCTILKLKCKFEGNLNFKVQMDAEGAFADPEGKEFKLIEGPIGCGTIMKWESGRTRFNWRLDDKAVQNDGTLGTIHKHIWPTLLEKLTLKEPVVLAKE